MYTVKQVADIAGVSIRTLHYYDEIGLLKPSSVGDNGYRYYEEDVLLKLQQVLLFREMGLGLLQIKEILDSPDFDLVAALQSHRAALEQRIERLLGLIQTVDNTIMHLVGEVDLDKKRLFGGLSEEKQKQYEEEALREYDPDMVRQSIKRWNRYTAAEKQKIGEESEAIYADLLKVMDTGATSPEVQAIVARWHQHLRYFYEPTPEILRGLGHHYNSHPDFIATFQKLHPDLPAFLEAAITHYCDVREGIAV